MEPVDPADQPLDAHSGHAPALDTARVLNRVGVPALLLMITTGAGMAYALCNTAGTVVQMMGGAAVDPQLYAQLGLPVPSPREQMIYGLMGLGLACMQLLTGTLILVGAFQMRRLQSHGFALAGAILAVIPCITPCFGCLTIPFGIWALVVLFDREVQYAFALNAEGQLPDPY